MRKIIYIGFVGFLFVMGFLNLDGNDWEPVELPKFANNLFESGERIIPIEEWRDNLTGRWKFKTVMGKTSWKGEVVYRPDSTFERKITYKQKLKNKTERAGGTVKGKWSISEDNNSWLEIAKGEDCKILPEQYNVCSDFVGSVYYGESEHPVWVHELVRFNQEEIEIRSLWLGNDETRITKFTRVD